jgi:hypothetical protein
VERVVVLGIAILASAFAPGWAEAKCTPTPKPDLKVTAFEVHLSNPAYAVIDTDGVLEPTMRPNQSQLSDSVTDASIKTTWTWDFRAALGP